MLLKVRKETIFLALFFIVTLVIVSTIEYTQYKNETARIILVLILFILNAHVFRNMHKKQKEYLESVLNNVSDYFCAFNQDMNFTYCNKGAIRYLGSNPIGRKIGDVYPKHSYSHLEDMVQRAITQQKTIYNEYISPINNRWFGVNIYPAEDGGFSIFFRDIHEIKLANEELKQAKERFLKVFNLNPNITILGSMEGEPTFLDVNDAYLKATGLSRNDIIGHPARECKLVVDKRQFKDVNKFILEKGCISNREIKFCSGNKVRDGLLSAELIEISGATCVIIVITDITDKTRLNRELARYDSLNLVGEIAASIGHEVRNPMTTVRGYLQMFQFKPEFVAHKDRIETMIEELDRANAIITEFLTLAKNKATEIKPGSLNYIVSVLFPLIQADAFRLGHSVQMEVEPIDDILLDEKEVRQLILNLVRNALEAMGNNGVVRIKTYSKDTNAILEISDTGNGIPKSILDKIGTPFITTKENGTGLGLSVCYRIAQRHNAKIDLKTNSKGTTFFIRFPMIAG